MHVTPLKNSIYKLRHAADINCILRCNIRELSNIAEGRGWNGRPHGVEADRCGWAVSLAGAEAYIHTLSSARRHRPPQMRLPNVRSSRHKTYVYLKELKTIQTIWSGAKYIRPPSYNAAGVDPVRTWWDFRKMDDLKFCCTKKFPDLLLRIEVSSHPLLTVCEIGNE